MSKNHSFKFCHLFDFLFLKVIPLDQCCLVWVGSCQQFRGLIDNLFLLNFEIEKIRKISQMGNKFRERFNLLSYG